MKKSLIPYIVAAALALPLAAQAQTFTSKPVGFTTETLAADSFNLIGINFVSATEASGTITTNGGTTLTDSNADFSGLPGGSLHVELADGTLVQVSSVDSATQLTLASDITAAGNADYTIRTTQTIGDIFGTNNEAGLAEGGSASSADVIWVPEAGSFAQYYYAPEVTFPIQIDAGWKKVGASGYHADAPVPYWNGVFVETQTGSTPTVVISGNVKTTNTVIDLATGFNLVSLVYPQGVTLGQSGLDQFLTQGGSASSADVVWVPDGSGGFDQYYYAPEVTFPIQIDAGWKKVGASGYFGTTVIDASAVFIQAQSTASGAMTPPDSYSSL